jgi:hypothetical protein
MNEKISKILSSVVRDDCLQTAVQQVLWPDQGQEGDRSSAISRVSAGDGLLPSALNPASLNHGSRLSKALQDLLFSEALLATKLSVDCDTLEKLQAQLVARLGQNSQETRIRYSQSVLRWFFADGIAGLAGRVWAAYQDEGIQKDILRYLYLTAEPLLGGCVADALYPLEEGMLIPPNYFDQYLRERLGGEPSPKIRGRLKTNLMRLGFLTRARGKPDRLTPVIPTKTAFLIVFHYVFATNGQRTVEIRLLFANPFWKYLGFKSEDAVRAVLREADVAGLLGKYVVADQLEQVTTCLTLDEILVRKIRL